MKESFFTDLLGIETATYLYRFSTTVTKKTRRFLFVEWSDGSPLCVCAEMDGRNRFTYHVYTICQGSDMIKGI